MNGKELIRERLHRNGLLRPFASISDCVDKLVGIQSQFQQFAEVSIFNRCLKAPKLKAFQTLYDRHGIINLWGQRHTLHMYTPRDWGLICDVYHDKFMFPNYTGKFALDFAEMMETIEHEGVEEAYIRKERIIEILTARLGHVLTEEDYLDYLLIRNCCVQGVMFGVPAKPSIKRFASYTTVCGQKWTLDSGSTEKSLGDMMKRYFACYGPASLQDFCHWSGLPVGLAKDALCRVEPELTMQTMNGRAYYTHGEVELAGSNKLFLLGKFDPLFVSYKHKDWIVTKQQEKEIWRSAARVESVVLDGVKVIGTWRHALKGNRMTVTISPMAKISPAAGKRIQRKAEKLAVFWEKQLDAVLYA